ncbi:MFS transporter [Phenylobacterium sp.]|uniref:MFS transporter n=1 Tax=Phenylobacterium sp. TaxID=1871053 RepID=UPI0035B29FE7
MFERFVRLPRTVWALGLVSLFMDVSSEMIHGLLPVFLVSTLGASPALLGLIEGVAEATASITKVFSGWLSDRLGKRKLLTVAGYGLAALTKPVFPLAATPYEVLAARFADRIGKGVRDAPRDALITDVAPKQMRGAAFGLRQSLDTIGAVVGPGLAIGLMALMADDMRAVFGFAVIPAAAAVLLLIFGVKEPDGAAGAAAAPAPIRWADVRGIGTAFWIAVAVGVLFTMARFSEAFLVLRGSDAGLPLTLTPLVLIAMNVVYALVAAPAGGLSDRIGRRRLLAAGVVALIFADALLAWSGDLAGVMAGVALWGLHMGLTQGLLSALVADAAPARLRGTAFGLFNLATGVTQLMASLAAGAIWARWGAPATFMTGGGFALASLIGVTALLKARDPAPAAPKKGG